MIKGGKYLQQKRRKNIFKDKTTKNYYIIQISDPWVKKVGQNFEVWVGSGSDPTQPNPHFSGSGRTHSHPWALSPYSVK